MKRTLTMLLAAAAVLAGCAKTDEQAIDPSEVSESAFFYASIEQIPDLTRTTIDGNGIQWEKGDAILAYAANESDPATENQMTFYADKEGDEAFFSAKNISAAKTFHDENDATGYDVYFGTGEVTISTKSYTVPLIPMSIEGYESGSVRHLPMYSGVKKNEKGYAPGQRKATFRNNCAVLKVTIPENKLDEMTKFVVTSAAANDYIAGAYFMKKESEESDNKVINLLEDARSNSVTYSITAKSDERVFYIPVVPGSHQLTFKATDDAGTNYRTLAMVNAVNMEASKIYSIDFTTFEYEINAETTSIELPSNSGTVNIKVTEDNTKENVEIKYRDADADNHPAKVYINGGDHSISNLTITLPDSHVELSNGSAINVVSQTSKKTLVVNSTFSIGTGITVEKGNLEIHGTVEKVTIPLGVDQIITITADAKKVNKIVNNSGFKANISAEGADVTGQPESNFTIGSEKYTYLADAVSAALDNATIIVENSCPISSEVSVDKTIKLDLNGKELLSGNGSERIEIDGGSLTIEDNTTDKKGKIYQEESTNAHTIVVNSGILTVVSGSISSSQSAAVYVPENQTDASTINLNGGTLTGESSKTGAIGTGDGSQVTININGATINSETSRGVYTGSKTVVNMTAGTISSYKPGIYFNGTVTPEGDDAYGLHITGGEISGSYALYFYNSACKACIEGEVYLEATTGHVIYGYSGSSTSEITIRMKDDEEPYLYAATAEKTIIYCYSTTASKQPKFEISAGYFNTPEGVTTARLAEGYSCITLADPVSYKDKSFGYKAGIAEDEIFEISDGKVSKKYTTPTAAMNALFGTDPDTDFTENKINVSLLSDYTLTAMMTFTAATSEKEYTFDLNGHTLTTGNDAAHIKIAGSTKLTIKNSLSDNSGGIVGLDYWCLYSTGNSVVSIDESVTIDNQSGSSGRGAIWLTGSSNLTCDGCTLKISNTENNHDVIGVGNASSKLTVKNEATITTVASGATIDLDIKPSEVKIDDGVKSRPYIPSVYLASGQYQDKYATDEEYATVASGYSGSAESMFECIPMSLDSAVMMANSSSYSPTIKLLKKITVTDTVKFTNTGLESVISLDLNSNQLTSNGITCVVKSSADSLRIFDSGTDGKITIGRTADYARAIEVTKGSVGIYSGTIAHTATGSYYLRNAVVVSGADGPANLWIHGGTFYSYGRVIAAGSGSSSNKCRVYITGGIIKSDNAKSTTVNFALLKSIEKYAYFYVWGGKIYAHLQPAIHISNSYSYVYLGQDGDNNSIPFIHGDENCSVLVSRSDSYGKYYVYNAYLNLDKVTEAIKSDGTTASITELSTTVSDGTYSDYKYKFSKTTSTTD